MNKDTTVVSVLESAKGEFIALGSDKKLYVWDRVKGDWELLKEKSEKEKKDEDRGTVSTK